MTRRRGRPGLLPAPLYFALALLLSAVAFLWVADDGPRLRQQLMVWLQLRPPLQVRADSFYSLRIAPLLEEKCAGCHGPNRQRARLRIDSLQALHAGGRHGAALIAGLPGGSELYRRVALAAGDPALMPPSGHERLDADELKILRLWIERGASGLTLPSAFVEAPPPPRKVVIVRVDRNRVEDERAPLAFEVQKLQSEYPNLISYVSRSSAELRLNAALAGEKFGDADMVRISPLGLRIEWLDLTGTAVTDASAPIIAHMAGLRTLRLSQSRVGDSTVHSLAALANLKSISVFEGQVSEPALQPLRDQGVTIHVQSPESELASDST